MRRVIATQRNFVFGSGFRKLAVFCPNLIRCCVRSAVGTHPCARRLSVALRSQGRSLSVLLPFSFPDRHSAKRDGGLLLPCPRGDRPPGNVPDGMSKIKFRSFPQNYSELYQNRRALIKRVLCQSERNFRFCLVGQRLRMNRRLIEVEHLPFPYPPMGGPCVYFVKAASVGTLIPLFLG